MMQIAELPTYDTVMREWAKRHTGGRQSSPPTTDLQAIEDKSQITETTDYKPAMDE